MINIKPTHLDIIKKILSSCDYDFYIFGSRITDRVKEFSDVDLFYVETLPGHVLTQLQEAFEESDLPYKVDLVDYTSSDPEFKKIMKSKHVWLQQSSRRREVD